MMTKPRHLELYAGGGGSAEGYRRAGCDVLAIDIHLRRDLPPGIEFIKADVRDVLKDQTFLRSFDSIGASPPCQLFTRASTLREAQGKTSSKLNLIPETRDALMASGVPFVIENVPEAPLRADLLLCGSMFPDLRVIDETGVRWLKRHRIFEFGNGAVPPTQPSCCTCLGGCTKSGCGHAAAGVRAMGVYASKADNIPGGGQTARTLDEGRQLMGIDWMSWSALVESIPPDYTDHIGCSLVWDYWLREAQK